MSQYNKFVAAFVAALAVAASVASDGSLDLSDWLAVASAFVGALAVRQVANSTADVSDSV